MALGASSRRAPAGGAFSRMVRLLASVAADKIKATFKKGVLAVTLPKTEEAKQGVIPITVE